MYELLKRVYEKRLYKNIIETMGPNDPVFNQDKLDAAADYISSQLEEYGLQVSEHVFEIEGREYRNIEGLISRGEGPELLLTSHYDTKPRAPGADDNLSGVSVMLESARILAEAGGPLNVRFVGFTLEEGHPNRFAVEISSAQELGLMDEHFNFENLSTQMLRKRFREYISQGRRGGREHRDSVDLFFDECMGMMNEADLSYFRGLGDFYGNITVDSYADNYGLTGSSRWVEERAHSADIAGVVNLDTVGYYTQLPNSQRFPAGMVPEMFQRHLVDDMYVGNFLAGIGDVNSGSLLELFASCCKLEEVKLPFAWLHAPFSYEEMKYKMYDLLRTDCTPFWREGIPAIFLSDSAEFRTPFYHIYHSQADTIDKLDFGCIAKVCRASIATALNSSTLNQ
jgi:hypothetical protein